MDYFYDMLEKIHQKPAMYLGSASLSSLFMYLLGYQSARYDMGIPATEQETEFREFQAWIQHKYRILASVSWDKIILLYSPDEPTAFNKFFELLTQFQKEQAKKSTSAKVS